jgi:hypothetical protein
MDGKQLVTGADARQSRSGGAADSNRSAQRNIVVRRRHTGALSTSNELARAHASVSAMLIKCKEKTRCRSVRMYGLEVRKLFGTCFLTAFAFCFEVSPPAIADALLRSCMGFYASCARVHTHTLSSGCIRFSLLDSPWRHLFSTWRCASGAIRKLQPH